MTSAIPSSDLTAFIDADFPLPTFRSRSSASNESFAHTRLVDRAPLEQSLRWTPPERKDNEAVILIGAQGSGKTLLCKTASTPP